MEVTGMGGRSATARCVQISVSTGECYPSFELFGEVLARL